MLKNKQYKLTKQRNISLTTYKALLNIDLRRNIPRIHIQIFHKTPRLEVK